jgi:hypothetical protein
MVPALPLQLPPKRPSIADRVARAFPPLACVRGYRYFARGRVNLASVSEAGLDAEVKGQRVQHVRLRVEDGRLASGCSCAPKVLGPAACRHVWATLLEIDRQGALDGLRGSQRALALTALDAPASKPPRTTKPPTPETPTETTKTAKTAKTAKTTKTTKVEKPLEPTKTRGRVRGRT